MIQIDELENIMVWYCNQFGLIDSLIINGTTSYLYDSNSQIKPHV